MGRPPKRYGVILADPEWGFEVWSRETRLGRATDDLFCDVRRRVVKLWPVESLAAPDCVLFLWTTASLLPRALEAMEAWGFDYKSHFIWAKDRWGTGDWNRSQHELLLVGTKGDVPAPRPARNCRR